MNIDPKDFQFVRELVKAKAAIILDDGKEYLVEARLKPLCRLKDFDTIGDLVKQLRTRPPELVSLVIEAITTNETSFFRDMHPFDAMKTTIVPELIERKKATRSIDIWCAASSSGQEPLTIAMTIREHFPEIADWNVRILATDINQEMLERCRSGLYSQLEVSRGLPARMLIKYFAKAGTQWKVKDEILGMIEYKQLNLAENLPVMRPMDIVFIRNVLIYFDRETKAKILEGAHGVLDPGGFLFLGTAESTSNLTACFTARPLEKATCYMRAA